MILITAYQNFECKIPLRKLQDVGEGNDILSYISTLALNNRGWKANLSKADPQEIEAWVRIDLVGKCLRVIANEGLIEINEKTFDTTKYTVSEILDLVGLVFITREIEVLDDEDYLLIKAGPCYRA